MATCTKGFVLTPCKDVFLVCERIEQAINKLIRPRVREELLAGRGLNTKAFSTCSTHMYASSQSVRIVFTYEQETYTMSVHFSCDCDYAKYGPSSISISLGMRKEASRFVKAALEGLALFGEVYFIADDSEDKRPAEKLGYQAPTYIQACADGDVSEESNISLGNWNRRVLAGEIVGPVGLTAAETYEICQMPYPDSRLAVQERVQKHKAEHQPALT